LDERFEPFQIPDFQEAQNFQRAQRFPHRSPADAEGFNELAFGGEFVAGPARVFENRFPDLLADGFGDLVCFDCFEHVVFRLKGKTTSRCQSSGLPLSLDPEPLGWNFLVNRILIFVGIETCHIPRPQVKPIKILNYYIWILSVQIRR
jgi:hypothetical protein